LRCLSLRSYKIVALAIVLVIVSTTGVFRYTSSKPKEGPEVSIQSDETHKESAIKEFPWTDVEALNRAKEVNKTYKPIAMYHASLPDPILNERHNIALGAKYVCGAVVQPDETFSLNQRLGWRSRQRGFLEGPMYSGNRVVPTVGGGICKIASVMYNTAVLANLKIVERHAHSMTVPYVPPGQDATISYGVKDFKFMNITKHPILIWVENIGDTLYMAFYGSSLPPKVEWIHDILLKKKTWTRRINDPTLPKGSEKVIYEGSDGIVVHSWTRISYHDGATEKRDMGISSYRQGPRIIAVGTK
jgi:vancomycin resistance protein VanW